VNEVSDDIIDGLWSDGPPLQLESVTKIRRITSQSKNFLCFLLSLLFLDLGLKDSSFIIYSNIFPGDISCVIRSGVVPRLVQLLKNQVFPKLQVS